MGIHDDTGCYPKSISEHHVGGLSGNTSEGEQVIHRPRHLAAKFLDKARARRSNVPRFVPEEARCANVVLQFAGRDSEIIFRLAIFAKEVGGDDIDACVGALRGEDRRDQEFERRRVVKGTVRVGICLSQPLNDLGGTQFEVGDHGV